jgi:hypothetical protein
VDLVGDSLDTRAAHLLLYAVSEQQVARRVADVHDAFFRVCRRFDNGNGRVGRDGLDVCPVFGGEVGEADNVNLVDDEQDGLVGE